MLEGLSEVNVIKPGRYASETCLTAPILLLRKGKRLSPDKLDWGIVRRTRQMIAPYTRVTNAYTLSPAQEDNRTVPLQVSINSIDILALAFRTDAEQVLDATIQRLYWDLTAIWELTKGNVVFVLESPIVHLIATATHCKARSVINWFAGAFLRVLGALPDGAKWGFHFCNRRIASWTRLDTSIARLAQLPQVVHDFQWTVKLSNFLLDYFETHGFSPTFVHYPLVLEDRRPNFSKQGFLQFKNLRVADSTRVYFGAVHPQCKVKELVYLYQWLDDLLKRREGSVGVSPSCGWGLSTKEEMTKSFALMRTIAY
jgi:hypothetical protein